MTKQVINVGTPPGGSGDGDTLRGAFIKTNSNFSELYTVYPVTDTSLNHDDPSTDGTIANALADAGNAGGGTVLVGAGLFNCPNTTLTIPKNVTLKGVGRRATIINVTGSQDGITLPNQFCNVESLRINMPIFSSGDGIKLTTNHITLRDLTMSGVGSNSWAINADGVNVCRMDNILIGTLINGGPDVLRGNGIIFQNTDFVEKPFNFGDSLLSKIDISLYSNNTTGIMLSGPDNTNNVINNILLSQVEVIGTGQTGGCTGFHLKNSKRIASHSVDLENLEFGVIEESTGIGANRSSNNVFISTYTLNTATSYSSAGNVSRRSFIGCDNLEPDSLDDADTLLPNSLWLNNGVTRVAAPAEGVLTISNENSNNGLRITADSINPAIRSSSDATSASLSLGQINTRGVECLPGLILPALNNPIPNPAEGTIAQFMPGIVGPNRGLYQLRGGSWIFIG